MHINRLFQENIGTSPAKYINALRIEKAKEQLKRTNHGITSIAFECGFGSLSTFERAFKRIYHCSPQEFRKRV
ncbi:helix-turn-helix transcriptional regulator [Bacillus sp. AK128]